MNIDAWEREVLHNFRDDDLACLVQLMRMLGWATIGMPMPKPLVEATWDADHRDLATFELVIAHLEHLADDPVFATLLRLWRRVQDGLAAGPRVPPERELLVRYVRGGIGDRTVRMILSIDSYALIERCWAHGLPPVQIGPEWSDDE